MKLFKKNIFCEVCATCCAAVVLFVAILLAVNVLRDIAEWIASKKISLVETVRILFVLGPSVISYALPLGMLSGILMVFGRMSSSNEILALKSIGVSLREISTPVVWLSIFCTIVSAYINLFYAPDSVSKYRQFFRKLVQEKPMRFISAKKFNDYFPGYVIYVDDLIDGKFSGMRIWQFNADNLLEMYIFAKHGNMVFDETNNSFLLKMQNGNAEKFDHNMNSPDKHIPQIIFFENIDINLPARELVKTQYSGIKKLSHMTFSELLAAKRHCLSTEKERPYEEIRHFKTLINMHISKRIAEAVGIFVMSLLAIPLGLKNNRADKSINLIIAFVLCLGYYFTMIVFSWFGDATRLRPDLLIWLPNIVLTAIGITLFERANKR